MYFGTECYHIWAYRKKFGIYDKCKPFPIHYENHYFTLKLFSRIFE